MLPSLHWVKYQHDRRRKNCADAFWRTTQSNAVGHAVGENISRGHSNVLSAGQVGAQFANASMQWGFDGRTKTGTTGSLNKTATNKSNTKVSLQRQLLTLVVKSVGEVSRKPHDFLSAQPKK